jgi:hypothetical protein
MVKETLPGSPTVFAISAHAPAFESVESVMVIDGASKVLMCAWKEFESVASFRTSSESR